MSTPEANRSSGGTVTQAKAITFFVEGRPEGKDRPRFGHGRVFTTKKTSSYEALIRLRAIEAGARLDTTSWVGVWIQAFHPRPKRLPKDRDWAKCKPDLDNIVKVILDSLNGVAYSDDSQVVDISAFKMYTDSGDPDSKPGVRVRIIYGRPGGTHGTLPERVLPELRSPVVQMPVWGVATGRVVPTASCPDAPEGVHPDHAAPAPTPDTSPDAPAGPCRRGGPDPADAPAAPDSPDHVHPG